MTDAEAGRVKDFVREVYGRAARGEIAGCGCSSGGCGGVGGGGETPTAVLGYTDRDLEAIAGAAELALGCGNPRMLARFRPGETVLDLGSGAGLDCLVAAREVGPEGRVIGVDMTPDMVARARRNAAAAGVDNVEFRLGEIETLPVPDGSVDVIISNCVLNLSRDGERVYREAFRVLRPGGRLAIMDIVATGPIPREIREDLRSIAACVGGAREAGEIERTLAAIGFRRVSVKVIEESRKAIADLLPDRGTGIPVASASISAVRPKEVRS